MVFKVILMLFGTFAHFGTFCLETLTGIFSVYEIMTVGCSSTFSVFEALTVRC